MRLIGDFNKRNAQAAKTAAKAIFPDISDAKADESLKKFQGTWRRFEYKGKTKRGADVYDDYAHHPTAISLTLDSVKKKFPDKKIVLAFHPHLYSRTRDLFNDFVMSLSKADRVLLAPIYPAREEPVPGVTSDALASAIAAKNPNVLSLPSLEAIRNELEASTGEKDLILTMGAGDIYTVADVVGKK